MIRILKGNTFEIVHMEENKLTWNIITSYASHSKCTQIKI